MIQRKSFLKEVKVLSSSTHNSNGIFKQAYSNWIPYLTEMVYCRLVVDSIDPN